jgi:hypothetical protein
MRSPSSRIATATPSFEGGGEAFESSQSAGRRRAGRRDNLRPGGLSEREIEVAPGRSRVLQSGDRRPPGHLASNGRAPRAAHLRESGRIEPGRSRALRPRARPRLAGRGGLGEPRTPERGRLCCARKMGRPTDVRRALAGDACKHTPDPQREVEMPHISANDVELHYEVTGRGEPLVLVHGGWSDLHNWQAVAPGLAQSFLVVAYDRRGSRPERAS